MTRQTVEPVRIIRYELCRNESRPGVARGSTMCIHIQTRTMVAGPAAARADDGPVAFDQSRDPVSPRLTVLLAGIVVGALAASFWWAVALFVLRW